jgi:hypothetical protein
MDAEPREGLEEYARTLDLNAREVLDLLDLALAENEPEAS